MDPRQHIANDARRRLAFALDVGTLAEVRELVELLKGHVGVFKVGLELFTAVGPEAIRIVHAAGAECFLDLKLHDIPTTMAGAVRAAKQHNVRYLTVHAAAGALALHEAQRAAGNDLVLLAVSVLTSADDGALREGGITASVAEQVQRLAQLAAKAGVPGIVCSSHECAELRQTFGGQILLVVPGIRSEGQAQHDQKRAATPARALALGADILVVGRSIRDAPDPRACAQAIVEDIARDSVRREA